MRMRHLNFLPAQGRCPAQPARMGICLKPQVPWTGSPHAMSAPHLLKEHHGSHDKDSHSSSSKHQDKCHKDEEDSKSLHKYMTSPVQRSSTVWAEKEPWLKEPPMVFHASSRNLHLSESDKQLSFSCPTSASTPSKTTGGPTPNRCPVTADVL